MRLKNSDQVTALYHFFNFLRRLRIIDVAATNVVREPLSESGRGPAHFCIEITHIRKRRYETIEE